LAGLITLTTDFGYQDNYVGAMKGAILSVCPEARIVDISHSIAPQQIGQAVYVATTSWPYFPKSTIHVAVVDPGVGTERRALVLCGSQGFYVGPDNGVLSAALPPELRPNVAQTVRPGPHLLAFELANPTYFRPSVSNTFHGRDIFGPVAGHLAAGIPVESFGPAVDEMFALPASTATRSGHGVDGRIQHIDVYGNLVSDIAESMLDCRRVDVTIEGKTISGLGRTYSENEGLFALVTSDGWLAIARVNSSAAAELGATIGDKIQVRW
jgi:S-adenosyl-L-methionine hydrolase (adenosine-forming)